MIPYFAVFYIISFCYLLSSDRKLVGFDHALAFLLTVLLVLFSGLRGEDVGADYLSYKEMFYSFEGILHGGLDQVLAFDYFFEPGFALLIVVLRTFVEHHVWFFAIITALTLMVLFWCSVRLSRNVCASFLVYYSYLFFTHGFVAIRFGLASALSLIFLVCIAERKYLSAILIYAICLSIHTAAIVLIVPFVLIVIRERRSIYVAGLLGALVVGFFSIGDFLMSIVPGWLPRSDSAATYVGDEQFGRSLGFLGLVNIKYLLLMFLCFLKWEKLITVNRYFSYILLFMLCSVIIRISLHDLGFIVGRLSALLGLVEIFIVPALASVYFGKGLTSLFCVFVYSLINIVMLIFVRGFDSYHLFYGAFS